MPPMNPHLPRSWRETPLLAFGLACAFSLAAAAAPAQQPAAPPAATATTPASPTAATPATAHDQLLAVLWMQRSAEYTAACLQTFHQARQQLENALDDPRWTACLEQDDPDHYVDLPPAIVVDVDETVLDNSAFAARQIRAGVTKFDPKAWREWVREQQALPVPGALAYLTAAAQRGVRIVYVTNRSADSEKEGVVSTEETDTRRNLARLGFPLVESHGEDLVLCAGEIGDKAARRREVCKTFRVVQLIGDNLGDFAPGTEPRKVAGTEAKVAENATTERLRSALASDFAAHWGTRWFLIPNPSYGGFETVLRGQYDDLGEALRLQR